MCENMNTFEIKKEYGDARRGTLHTAHGDVQTPCFMNVGTQGAIKGGLSAHDLETVNCQIELSNTYHLHVRLVPAAQNGASAQQTTDTLIRSLGGLHKFMGWNKPILTDSGGFQIFSLAGLRKITEDGVKFQSHVDGRHIFMSPENCVQIQSNLGSDIAMAFDECIEIPSPYEYVKASTGRTTRWLIRCRDEWLLQVSKDDAVNRGQLLFGINQGSIFHDIRVEHMKEIADLDLPGYAIGGLAVGETHSEMYDTIQAVRPYMPHNKPRYLMGVGTPANIAEGVARGIDMFDCVMPARNGRHGHLFTHSGIVNISNAKYAFDDTAIDEKCACPVCKTHSRAYLRHLFKCGEILGLRLAVMHNLWFYNDLMTRIRDSIEDGTFDALKKEICEAYA